jgi:hypothetical protein
MKVKIIAEIHVDIPGEFQDDELATQLLQDEVNERFDIGCEYDKYDQPSVMFTSAKIIQYIPGLGKL